MESYINKVAPTIPLDMLVDRLIHQINYVVIYKEKPNLDEISLSLDYLDALPLHHTQTLLHLCNEQGWKYGQLLAGIEDGVIVQKYLALLDKLSQKIAGERILELLRLTSAENVMLGRNANAQGKQLFLNFLLQLCQHEHGDKSVPLEDVRALLETPDKQGMTFVHDVARELTPKSKAPEKQAYFELACFMLNHGFLSSGGYALLANYEDEIRQYLLALPEEKKVIELKNALDSEHPLGALFRFKHRSDVTESLVHFRRELHRLKPFESDTMSEYEVSRCEAASQLRPLSLPLPPLQSDSQSQPQQRKSWWNNWPAFHKSTPNKTSKPKQNRLKVKKAAESADENNIPLQTFSCKEQEGVDENKPKGSPKLN